MDKKAFLRGLTQMFQVKAIEKKIKIAGITPPLSLSLSFFKERKYMEANSGEGGRM